METDGVWSGHAWPGDASFNYDTRVILRHQTPQSVGLCFVFSHFEKAELNGLRISKKYEKL